MPALGGLTDRQIASVLTYIREAFGGNASAVSTSEVQAVREKFRQRETAWKVSEL